MDNHKLVVTILVLAILFSVAATVMSLSILDFKPVFVENRQVINSADDSSGGVSVSIESYVPSEDLVLP